MVCFQGDVLGFPPLLPGKKGLGDEGEQRFMLHARGLMSHQLDFAEKLCPFFLTDPKDNGLVQQVAQNNISTKNLSNSQYINI